MSVHSRIVSISDLLDFSPLPTIAYHTPPIDDLDIQLLNIPHLLKWAKFEQTGFRLCEQSQSLQTAIEWMFKGSASVRRLDLTLHEDQQILIKTNKPKLDRVPSLSQLDSSDFRLAESLEIHLSTTERDKNSVFVRTAIVRRDVPSSIQVKALFNLLNSWTDAIEGLESKMPNLANRLGKLFVFDKIEEINCDENFRVSIPTTKYAFHSHWFIKNISHLKMVITNERTLNQTKIEFGSSANSLSVEKIKNPSLQHTCPSVDKSSLAARVHRQNPNSYDFKVEILGSVKLFAVFDVSLPFVEIQTRIRGKRCVLKLSRVKTTRSVNILLSLFGVPKLFELLTKSFYLSVEAKETDDGTNLHWNSNFVLPSSSRCVSVLWKLGFIDMTLHFFRSIRKTLDAVVRDLKQLKNDGGMEVEEVEHSSIIYYADE